MNPIVKFTNVSKQYDLYRHKKGLMTSFRKPFSTFTALSNISFELYRGETIGMIGASGSGKSTLARLIGNLTSPTTGAIKIAGTPAFVSISTAVYTDGTGYERIREKCIHYGIGKDQIEEVLPDIINFSEMDEFMDQPVQTYSNEMKLRLELAIALYVPSELIVIDEDLSRLHDKFYEKCSLKFKELKSRGKSIVFVANSLDEAKAFSDRVIWLDYGEMEMFSETSKVMERYFKFKNSMDNLSPHEKRDIQERKRHEQLHKDLVETNPVKRVKNKRSKKAAFYIPFVSLTLILLIAGGFMLIKQFNSPAATVATTGEDTSDTPTEISDVPKSEELNEPKQVDKPGYVIDDSATLYETKELTGEIKDIPFATEVFVEERIGGVYQVTYEDEVVYLPENSVKVGEVTGQSSIELVDIVPALPEVFANSYEYFFAFLGTDYETVKSSLNGLTDESKNRFGNSVLTYGNEGVSYVFNESNSSEVIKVKDINVNAPIIERIVEEAAVASEENKLYYLSTEQLDIYLDLKNELIEFHQ